MSKKFQDLTLETKEVQSVAEATSLGYKYVIAWRDHYRGNSKGEIYTCNEANANVCVNHVAMDDRGIYSMFATNVDVVSMVRRRRRIINLIQSVEWSMTQHSPLYSGAKREYAGSKMVFGIWRSIYRTVECKGAVNYDSNNFSKRHNCILNRLRELLAETSGVSSTMSIC